jgi:hypothetical protein
LVLFLAHHFCSSHPLKQPVIDFLTLLAEDNIAHGEVIAAILQERIYVSVMTA